MESEDLTPRTCAERAFDERLRLELACPALPDAGFSHRVVKALRRKRLHATLRRRALMVGGLVAGTTFGCWTTNFESGAVQAITDAWQGAFTTSWLADPTVWLIGSVGLTCLAWAFQRELRELIDV